MMIRTSRRIMLAIAMGSLLVASPMFANEMEAAPDDGMAMDDAAPDDGMAMEDPARLDAERQRLLETALRDDARDLEEAETTLSEREQALEDAIDAGADQHVIDALERERDEAQDALAAERDEDEALREALLALSDDQVVATNRALNNAVKNRTITDLDAATLEEIAERDLNRREIQALTKALEEDAKFTAIGSRFEQKYEQTGKESFLDKRDRMVERGERQRDKFDRKVDRMVEARDGVRSEIRAETRNEARQAARQNAKAEAKRVAREEARREHRGVGRARN